MTSIQTDLGLPAETRAVHVAGWAKTTLLDYPGHVASTLFLQGCNFRCPYCHNPDLVLHDPVNGQVPLDLGEILAYMATYTRMLEGVCVTGGEPLLQGGLAEMCRSIRGLGLKVKLDTNGSLPERLASLLEASLLDYVAVDIKGPPGKIHDICRTAMPESALVAATERTVRLLEASGVAYELRTTVVPGLIDGNDLAALAGWLQGGHRYVLQQFRPGECLDPLFCDVPAYSPETLKEEAKALSGFFAEVIVRGLDG